MQNTKYFKEKRKTSIVWRMGQGKTKGSGYESKAVAPLSLDLSRWLNSAGRRDSSRAPLLPPSPVTHSRFIFGPHNTMPIPQSVSGKEITGKNRFSLKGWKSILTLISANHHHITGVHNCYPGRRSCGVAIYGD